MLKVLPPGISNLIAAGEVVQRPASIVKELMENAVDAGAESVTVLIEDSGRTSIQIIDDGSGMTPEEAELCFERHATSKIGAAEDLESILTYGFRGEALPSIAAVSDVVLRTRKKDRETGCEVQHPATLLSSTEEISCPPGTNIVVSNLFYNVPARRKFLKSDQVEFRHILSEFSHVALCRPEVSFRLVSNGKDIYDLRKALSLKQRILEIDGKGLIKELVDLDTHTDLVRISGFVGNPEDARRSGGNQKFFVNGRYFRSPYFHKALMKAYEKLIPEGYLPSYYIYFETDPSNVDVNIHPAKTEVKFENESEIFEILTAAVRESLGKNTFIPEIDFNHDTLPDFSVPSPGSSFSSRVGVPPLKGYGIPKVKTDYTPLVSQIIPSGIDLERQDGEDQHRLFEEKDMGRDVILQLGSRYLLTAVRSGILAIDVRRARERIFYERFLHDLDNSVPIAQKVLFPCHVELSPASYAVLMEDPDRLRMLGFDIVPFGPSSVAVNGLPDGFATDEESVRTALDTLTALLAEYRSDAMIKAEGRERLAAGLARSAIGGMSGRLSQNEARLLVDSLFACAEPDRSPAGKKCMEIITEEELKKRL